MASAAWALSTVMMKTPLQEIEPLTAQAIRLPLASAPPPASTASASSLKYAGVTIGAVLSSTAPLFALPLGVLFLGERASVWTVLGALVAVAGIVVLQL